MNIFLEKEPKQKFQLFIVKCLRSYKLTSAFEIPVGTCLRPLAGAVSLLQTLLLALGIL